MAKAFGAFDLKNSACWISSVFRLIRPVSSSRLLVRTSFSGEALMVGDGVAAAVAGLSLGAAGFAFAAFSMTSSLATMDLFSSDNLACSALSAAIMAAWSISAFCRAVSCAGVSGSGMLRMVLQTPNPVIFPEEGELRKMPAMP